MLTIHTLSFYLHILFGSMALTLFWIPMTAKKGHLNHKKFGRFYSQVMLWVALSGAIMSVLVLWDPVAIHPDRFRSDVNQNRLTAEIRVFYGLLLYLSILIYAGLIHGDLALKSKKDAKAMQTPTHFFSNALLITGAPLLFWFGWQYQQTLPLIFSALGLFTGLNNLKYAQIAKHYPEDWLKEHLGAMIATGIGAYTAFFAFGGRTLLGNIGDWQLFFWIAPGVLGGITIRQMSQKYAPDKPKTHNYLREEH